MAKFGFTHGFITVYAENDGESDVVGGVKHSEIVDEDNDYDLEEFDDYVGLDDDDYQSVASNDEFVEAKRKLRLYRRGQDDDDDEHSNDQHSGQGEADLSEFIESEYLERFRENPEWCVNEMVSDVQRRFAITVSKGTKYRAKAISLNMIYGSLGRDGNNQMFPISWAIVEGENPELWTWFIIRLCDDLSIQDIIGWTMICDQQKARSKPIIDMLKYVRRAVMRRMGEKMEMIKKVDDFIYAQDKEDIGRKKVEEWGMLFYTCW
ncbi:hypothetical protein CRG98_008001 [Punica granatum]|uniref:MULE transposase domain-containing protein n=1 Tax=Punica granatum TaxID=22663 RepID=A0A2I0KTE4_PUNGR|nr:hypothetical protein CRG98_008001 [Punica granatum]